MWDPKTGDIKPAAEVLASNGLKPLKLGAKEGKTAWRALFMLQSGATSDSLPSLDHELSSARPWCAGSPIRARPVTLTSPLPRPACHPTRPDSTANPTPCRACADQRDADDDRRRGRGAAPGR